MIERIMLDIKPPLKSIPSSIPSQSNEPNIESATPEIHVSQITHAQLSLLQNPLILNTTTYNIQNSIPLYILPLLQKRLNNGLIKELKFRDLLKPEDQSKFDCKCDIVLAVSDLSNPLISLIKNGKSELRTVYILDTLDQQISAVSLKDAPGNSSQQNTPGTNQAEFDRGQTKKKKMNLNLVITKKNTDDQMKLTASPNDQAQPLETYSLITPNLIIGTII